MNTAVQLYRPGLKPIGHNIRMSPHTWDPQLNAARYVCICSPAIFIGDYFGVDARGGYAYTSSVSTYNEGGRNPLFDQQQDVARLKIPSPRALPAFPANELVERLARMRSAA